MQGLTAPLCREACPAGADEADAEKNAEAHETMFIAAEGRGFYHWLGFEPTEAHTASATAAVVNSLPRPSWQPLFVLLQVAGCLYFVARAGRELGLAVSLVTVVTTYLLFDLYSGLVHYCLDWEGFNWLPLFGPLCRTFQHHHLDTTFIWRSNFWTNLSEVGFFLHLSDTMPLALLSGLGVHVPPIYWYCSAWKTLHSMVGELAHRAAHKPPHMRSGFERWMQRRGIYLDPEYHLNGHHGLDGSDASSASTSSAPTFHEQFCELGWMDPVFDAMRLVTTNRWAWAAFTIWFSVADTWLLGAATTAVASGWPMAGAWPVAGARA